jgi:hypothetical protein
MLPERIAIRPCCLGAAGLCAALPCLRGEKSVAVVKRYVTEQETRAAELKRRIEELARTPPAAPPAADGQCARELTELTWVNALRASPWS